MKKLLSILVLFSCYFGNAQTEVQRSTGSNTLVDPNLFTSKGFRPPVAYDTVAANQLSPTLDSAGKIFYSFKDKNFWYRQHSPKKWVIMGNINNSTYVTSVTVVNDNTVRVCAGDGACQNITISNTVPTITTAAFLTDTSIVVCSTIGSCDTAFIPRQNVYAFQNGLTQVVKGVVELGGTLYHDTQINTDGFSLLTYGNPVYDYTAKFRQGQKFSDGTGIASFLHSGSAVGQPDASNTVTLGINYTGRSYPGIGTGYMGSKIGYMLNVNGTGRGSFGFKIDNVASKFGGIFFHTLDVDNSDALTFFGAKPTGVSEAWNMQPNTMDTTRIMVLQHNKEIVLKGYPSTRNDGAVTSGQKIFYPGADGKMQVGPINFTGGSGNTNSNIGSAYRFAVPFTNQIKTLANGYAVAIDSITSNTLTLRVDTSLIATRLRLKKSIDSLGALSLNSNVGSGYRLVVPTTQGIKTLIDGFGLNMDSTTNANAITLKADTTQVATLHALIDSSRVLRLAIGTGGGGGGVDGNNYPTAVSQSSNGTITINRDGLASISSGAATGTWGISVTGNAATVTNGLYSTSSYANPTWLTSLAYSKLTGAPTNLSSFTNDPGYLTSITHNHRIANSGGTSQFSFGVGEDIRFAQTGSATVSFDSLTRTVTIGATAGTGADGNFYHTAITATNGLIQLTSSTGAPTIDVNASGSWNINAASVTNGVYTNGTYANPAWLTSLAYSKLIGAPTNLSAFTNDPGYITSTAHNHTIADGGGTPQITYSLSDNLRVEGTGSTTVTYDDATNKITINSTGGGGGTDGNNYPTSVAYINSNGTIEVQRVGLATITSAPASGTWGINVTGNAATVTNGVYTNGSYANPSWITSLAYSKLTGTPEFILRNSMAAGNNLLKVVNADEAYVRKIRFTGASDTTASNDSVLIVDITSGGGGGTPANPTAVIGLSAINGAASTYMRSDAAPALDQAITPTWSALHTFTHTQTDIQGILRLGPTSGADGIIQVPTNEAATITNGSASAFRLLPFGSDIYFQNTLLAGNTYFTAGAGVASTGRHIFKSAGVDLDGTLKLTSSPATSAGTYEVLTRNTSTGVVEKVASSLLGGSAGVTSFSFTDANGFAGTVTNATTTPALSLTSNVLDTRVIFSNVGALRGDGNFRWLETTATQDITGKSYVHAIEFNPSAGTVRQNNQSNITWNTTTAQTSGSVYASNFALLDYTINANNTLSASTVHSANVNLLRIGSAATSAVTVAQGGSGIRALSANGVLVQANTVGGGITTSIDHVAGFQVYAIQQTDGSSVTTLPSIANYYGLLIGDGGEYVNMAAKITNRYAIYQSGTGDINYFAGRSRFMSVPEYADNAAASAGGLTTGTLYRTGDLVKIVH